MDPLLQRRDADGRRLSDEDKDLWWWDCQRSEYGGAYHGEDVSVVR